MRSREIRADNYTAKESLSLYKTLPNHKQILKSAFKDQKLRTLCLATRGDDRETIKITKSIVTNMQLLLILIKPKEL